MSWNTMDTAPREKRLLGVVDGDVRFIMWTKTSHVPLYGWCLLDEGEDLDFCEPTHWMPIPVPPEETAR